MANMTGTEEKIMNATIQCIEEYGLEGATIRRIAEMADVNSAAISYYFRSKDRLLEKAMEVSLMHAFDWDDFPGSGDAPLRERIESIFLRLAEGAYAFPGLTRAHFFDAFAKGEYNNLAVKKINEFLGELAADIKKNDSGRDETELRMALLQIASAVFLLPALMPRLFDEFSGIDLTDAESLKAYIHRAVERLL